MILYMHPYIDSKYGKTRATAAIDISNLDNIRVAFSFCSPKDQFSRKKGRLISTGRLQAGVTHMDFGDNGESPIKEQVMSFFEEDIMSNAEYLPNWLEYRL